MSTKTKLYVQMIKYGTGEFEEKVSSDMLETNDLYTVHNVCILMVDLNIPKFDVELLKLTEAECIAREIEVSEAKLNGLKAKHKDLLSNR
tara:strand:+ start:13737 stop:14006 length:270 start_codon:yes stop_codon:yes gene_type:complete